MRFVVLVLSGKPVIQRAMVLYIALRAAITPGVAAHQAGDTQNMAGRIAIIAR